MSTMLDILEKLTPLNRVFCSEDYDKSISYLMNLLPFRITEFDSRNVYNGWVIAPRWDVVKAGIFKDGVMIFDGTRSALSVIALSSPFSGRVSSEELKKHLYYDNRYDDAVPFHFRQMYRPWSRDWGFCVTKNFYDSLATGDYDVVIETRESEGSLKLIDYTHKGELDETIMIAAHLDHPGMANDDLAGCAVGVELFRRLQGRKTKYTYQLFIHQEVIGPEYYLGKMSDDERGKIIESLYLEMLGSETPLALQYSRCEETTIERAVESALVEKGVKHHVGPYGSIVSPGDYVWEGYGIPMSTLSRYPYPEYHCDRDNLALMSEDALEESVGVLMASIENIESTSLVFKNFKGNICTSNPDYDLYVDPGQASFGGFSTDREIQGLRKLMEMIPMIQKPVSVRTLADKAGLDELLAMKYLNKWADRGLLTIK